MQFKIPFGLRMAKKGFARSRFSKKPVGAAYIEGSKIIIDSNDIKTSPLSKSLGSRYSKIHAEVAVLKRLEGPLSGTLFIYREKKNGMLGMARPCESCLKLIRHKSIKTVVYSTEKGFCKEILK